MTSARKHAPAAVSPEAEAVIAEGLRAAHTPHKIQRRVRKDFGEKITLKAIALKKENHEREIGTKKQFKKKGADIVRRFLEKAKEGGDVSDLQAVLEQAVYFDCLRRYAADEDGFLKNVNSKDLLKITHDYQKARLQKLGAKPDSKNSKLPFSPAHAIQLLGIVEESLSDSPDLKAAFAGRREGLMKKIKPMFNREEFEAAAEDCETMQRIREKYELSKPGKSSGAKRGNSRATA